jgi:DNA invertase Pin-like site-specific DNA recombinase
MTIAIYIRLSLEDGDLSSGNKMESESITNQRSMLVDYIHTSPELYGAEIMEFCDDGYSGKNFDRPGVKRLIEAARNGGVQCVLVKDLSRFGRDYITVGNYIFRVFPFLGVRFISVNDRFDSQRKGDLDSLDTSFRTLIYDLYSRDLSRKVRSAKKNLAERGVYINPVAPYGYVKDPNDKHHLMIDPEPTKVVKRIFALVAEGKSTAQVAQTLNAEHFPTPSANKIGTSGAHKN